jgi:hypothetical protein
VTPSRDTVLVLGAGASFGARPHGQRRPPLGTGLATYLLHWLQTNDPRTDGHRSLLDGDDADPDEDLWDDYKELRALLEKAQGFGTADGFGRVMSELADGSKVGVLYALNSVIVASFLGGRDCAFEEEPDLYDRLFSALAGRLRAIVTPNYDILAEEALTRAGLPHYYGGVDVAGTAVALYKFHGSANFTLPIGAGRGVTVEIAQSGVKPIRTAAQVPFDSTYNDHPLYAIEGRRNALLHFNCHHRHQQHPVLVTYGPQKPAVYGLPRLEQVRAACILDLRENPPARIIATGIRPPFEDARGYDDPTWSSLCDLFRDLPSHKDYWSGVATERDSMVAFGFRGRDGLFEDLVADVENKGAR